MNFKQWLISCKSPSIFENSKDVDFLRADSSERARFQSLSQQIDQAYAIKDYKKAEELEVELEDLSNNLEDKLSDIGQEGGEEDDVDQDWSVQDDFANIYARYLNKKISDTDIFFILKDAILAPNINLSFPNMKLINSLDKESLLAMAKDAYLYKKNMHASLKGTGSLWGKK